jgi:diguanylate cyclase (GGDEF)-like protein/PAS domain S-box-containing protein
MRGPINDLVSLLFLIVFFSFFQRHRHQLYFRLWCIGWGFVFGSVIAWEPPLEQVAWVQVQDVVRYEFLLFGGLVFLASFVRTRGSVGRALGWVTVLFVPWSLVVGAEVYWARYAWLMGSLSALALLVSLRMAWVGIPKKWIWRRLLVMFVLLLSGAAMMVISRNDSNRQILNLMMAAILVNTALLCGGRLRKWKTVEWIGVVGFLMWGVFYIIPVLPERFSDWLTLVYLLWNIPKKLVGVAMILQVFEEGHREMLALADGYRLLYEDFRLLYEAHPYPMWIYEAEGGEILSVNGEAIRAYGYSEEEFRGLKMKDLEAGMDAESEEELRLLPATPNTHRARHLHKDGRKLWMNVKDRGIVFQGQEVMLRTARDITDRLKMNLELERRANHDALTGLPNRRLLMDRMQQSLARCERDERLAVLFMIDVDHFKQVNDTYGHMVGDECLRQVGSRLAAKIRQIDTIARMGGEEFAAVIGGLSSQRDAEKIGAMLLAQFTQPLRVGTLELWLTVSVGAAMYPADGLVSAELLNQADKALYQAKRMGRNRVVFWDDVGGDEEELAS